MNLATVLVLLLGPGAINAQCTGCFRGTSGPCKQSHNNVCGSLVGGVCPGGPGNKLCAVIVQTSQPISLPQIAPTKQPTDCIQGGGFCQKPADCNDRICAIDCPSDVPTGYYADLTSCASYCYCDPDGAKDRWENCGIDRLWDPMGWPYEQSWPGGAPTASFQWLNGAYGNQPGGMFGSTGGNCNWPDNLYDGRACSTNPPTYTAPVSASGCLTHQPTGGPPTKQPALPTNQPTDSPTYVPTEQPVAAPTTDEPTDSPTDTPTDQPVAAPTTDQPADSPTDAPTDQPVAAPTTDQPTDIPTYTPTDQPVAAPTDQPTDSPTDQPVIAPTTDHPTYSPTNQPVVAPTTDKPTYSQTEQPVVFPTTDQPTNPVNNKKTNSPTSEVVDKGGKFSIYSVLYDYCNCTASLNSINDPSGNDMNCVFNIEPTGNTYTSQIFAYEDCESPASDLVGLTSTSKDQNGAVVATIDLVRDKVAALVNPTGSGQIKYCIRTDVTEDIGGELLSVNYVQAFVTVNVFLDGNFVMDAEVDEDITLSEKVVDAFEKYYSVYAHQCDPETALNTNRIISQGEHLGICIMSAFTDTWIKKVNTVTLIQGNPNGGPDLTTQPVANSSPNIVSEYDCSLNDQRKCLVRTAMLSSFFVNDFMIVNVTGDVELLIRAGPAFNRDRNLRANSRSLVTGYKPKFDLKVSMKDSSFKSFMTPESGARSRMNLVSHLVSYVCGAAVSVIIGLS